MSRRKQKWLKTVIQQVGQEVLVESFHLIM
jgi:hypothetical protein